MRRQSGSPKVQIEGKSALRLKVADLFLPILNRVHGVISMKTGKMMADEYSTLTRADLFNPMNSVMDIDNIE
jgi:hypothetical protein